MASSSPRSATVFLLFLPFMRARTPVIPQPVSHVRPSFSNSALILSDVFVSLKPSSGSAKTLSATALMSARRARIASHTRRLRSSLLMMFLCVKVQQKKASSSDSTQAAGARLRITRRQNTPSRPNMISANTVAQMKLPAATANATGMIRQESALKASISLPTERPA